MHFLGRFYIIFAVSTLVPAPALSHDVFNSEVGVEQSVDSTEADAGMARIRQSIVSDTRLESDIGNGRASRMSPPGKLSSRRAKRSRHRTDEATASEASRNVNALESNPGHEQELASMATHAARSILGDSLHPVGSPRQRRKAVPPPIPSVDLEAVNRQSGESSTRKANARVAGESYDTTTEGATVEMDVSRLSTKRAAQEHVEMSLGHHRRRRKYRPGRHRHEREVHGGQDEL